MPRAAVWGHRAEREEVLRGHANEATQGQCGLPELMTKLARRAKTAQWRRKVGPWPIVWAEEGLDQARRGRFHFKP